MACIFYNMPYVFFDVLWRQKSMRHFCGKKRCRLKCFPTFTACFAGKNFQKREGLPLKAWNLFY